MKKILLFAICAFVLLPVNHARALTRHGWYFGGVGGANIIDIDVEGDASIDFETGYYAGGCVGFRFYPFLRIETELAFRKNQLDKITVSDETIDFSGSLSTWSYMGNLYLDLNCGFCFFPYVGVGAGYRKTDGSYTFDIPTSPPVIYQIEVDEKGIIYQGIVGISCSISEIWDVSLEGRYVYLDENERNYCLGLALKTYF